MTVSNDPLQSAAPGIGERLRAAREARGLSLEAVAAELRIRVVILAAMEREDHAALPERVYLLGLLRTYARFLGLDPANVAAGWAGVPDAPATEPQAKWGDGKAGARIESGLRQSFRNLLGLGLVGLVVLGAVGFLAAQAIRFASPPVVNVTSPAEEVLSLAAGTPATTVRGTAGAGTQVLIQNAIGDSVTTQADTSGIWSIEVPLSGGRNEFDISAADPATGSAGGAAIRRVFIVALPANDAPPLDVLTPTAGLRISGGPVPISLTTVPSGQVMIVATSSAGEVVNSSLPAQPDGKVQGDLLLPEGTWRISLQVSSPSGTISEALRDVEVVFAGVTVVLIGSDTGTWVRVWIDGAVDPNTGPSGITLAKGETRTIRGLSEVEIRFGNPRGALVALNGRMLGERGTAGVPESWSFRADGRVLSSNRK
jgi:cytoskeletal protein RodZ